MEFTKQKKYIALDVDSTLCTIEGIDELARHREVYAAVAQLTRQAMGGQVPMSEVFAARLGLIQPTETDLEWLAQQYQQHRHPLVGDFCRWLIAHDWDIFLITGGYRSAILPLAKDLGLTDDHVFANQLLFDTKGKYSGWDQAIPLWKTSGKREIIEQLKPTHPGYWVMMGDAQTDLLTTPAVNQFICFTGIAHRSAVVDQSSLVCQTYAEVITRLQTLSIQ